MDSKCCQPKDDCSKESKDEHGSSSKCSSGDFKCMSPEQKEFADNLFVNIISKPNKSGHCKKTGQGDCCPTNKEILPSQSAVNVGFEGDGESDNVLCSGWLQEGEISAVAGKRSECCTSSDASCSKGSCSSDTADVNSCCSEPAGTNSCYSGSAGANSCCSGSAEAKSCCSESAEAKSCCSESAEGKSCCSGSAEAKCCCPGSVEPKSCCPGSAEAKSCCSGSAEAKSCCSESAEAKSCCSESAEGKSCCSGSTEAKTCCSESAETKSCCSESAEGKSCCSGSAETKTCCSESAETKNCCPGSAEAKSCCSESAKANDCTSGSATKYDNRAVRFSEESQDQDCCKPLQKSSVKDDCCSNKIEQCKDKESSCFNNAGTVLDTCLPTETSSACCTSVSIESIESTVDNTIEYKTTKFNDQKAVGDSVKTCCATGEKKNKTCCSKSKKSSCADKEKKTNVAENEKLQSNDMPNLLSAMGNKVTYGSFRCCDDSDRSGCLLTCSSKAKEYTIVPCESSDKDTDNDEEAKIPDVITTTKLRIQNICCGKEAELMKRELEPLNGIEAVSVNVVGRIGFVKHNAAIIPTTKIVSILNNLHLGVSIMESGHHDDNEALNKEYFVRLGTKLGILFVLTLLFIPIIIGRVYKTDWRQWVAIAEIVIGGLPIVRKTILNWMKKVFIDINVLMLIAVIGTVALKEWLEGATVVFVFAIAECLQEYCTYRVQKAISGLMVHIPEEAVLAETGKSVPVEDVDIGSIIVVCAGEKIPLDGKVIKGQASVDESSITGESMPIEKSQGDKTYSGTIVQNGYLEIVTTSDSLNSTVSKVTQLVQEAQGKASHTEEIMNKFAKFYTPLVLVSALLIFAIPAILAQAKVGNYAAELHWWGVRALIVLLIACPCALVMSVPMPVVCGITAAARNGVLIKGGTHMENLAKIKTVALDKTGTLTEGRFRVVNIQEFGIGMKYNIIMEMIAALEIKSSHPVASAIVNHYSGCITDKIATFGAGVGLPDVFNFKSLPGLGLSGRVNGHAISVGNLQILQENVADVPYNAEVVYKEWSRHGQTVIFVVIGSKLAMMIGLADSPRPTAKLAIHMLKNLQIETIMLTGDSSGAAASVMREVGARSFIASMKPEDKLEWVREQQSEKNEKPTKVAMVGDGVNDGPSLAAADVGIAIGACATALAIESAGVALMSDSLVKIPETFVLSKFTRRVVFQNIALALAIKIAVMIATLVGSLTLWMAVLSDVVALLLVILNGFRPLFWKRREVKDDDNLKYAVDTIEDMDGDDEGIALIQIKS